MSLFILQKVSYVFPTGGAALDSIDLEIARGSRIVLLGANGAGKSTLLQILAGLQFPTKGKVFYEHEQLTQKAFSGNPQLRRSFRRKVGVLFQNPDAQLFCPTVWEEVAFGPMQLYSAEEAQERTFGILHSMGIEHLSNEAPFALSGGEKRKVALAAVLVTEPDVVLLDEPTVSLDASTTDFLMDWLREYGQSPGKTFISSTHDLLMAPELGNEAVVLTPCHKIARMGSLQNVLEETELLRQMNLLRRERISSSSAVPPLV